MESSLTARLDDLLPGGSVMPLVHALVILALGLLLARAARRAIERVLGRHGPRSGANVLRLVSWLITGTASVWALEELGFNVGVLLGAAGVVTVAVGFAAQSTLSNLLSGLFLLAERPFSIGDVIEVEKETGEVLAIDLLSTKLRTFDNRYVRIPNEVTFKTKVINTTRFPIRRVDIFLPVAYETDLAKLRPIILEVAALNPRCLAEPSPLLFVSRFEDSRVLMQFSVWCATPDYLSLLTTIQEEVTAALTAAGVQPALPRRVLVDQRSKHD